MSANTNRRMILKEYPKGAPRPEHFDIVEAPVSEPGPGEVLVRAIYLSVDPYMRGRLRPGPSYAEPQKIGEVMVGEITGEIVASNAKGFAVGDYVVTHNGWQTHGVADARDIRKLDPTAAP
ncbi:MAG: NADP-dependent oxidoreductase, partial [Alphaproteobacteria bacterium]